MQWSRLALVAVASFALLAGSPARAHWHRGHRHAHVELFVGVPLAGSWYSLPPYYYHRPPLVVVPPVATIPVSPPVYIEQDAEQTSGQQTRSGYWWYFCPSQRAYYPYVKTCPQGWQLVAPQPADLR